MDKDNELISVIIPVYNVKEYLRQCLYSVVSQSYLNLEIIVVDDGSTDGSSVICDKYASKDSRIKVFHTMNGGLSAARNFGLQQVSNEAKYIIFIDSDDWMEHNTINIMYNSAEEHKADLVTCLYYEEYLDRSVTISNLQKRYVLKQNQIMKAYLKRDFICDFAWNKLYRKELLSDIRYPVGRICEDIATTYRIIELSKCVVALPDKLIHYRVRDNSLSRNHSMKSLIDYWLSNYEKYNALYNKISDSASKRKLIESCLNAINRMMRWYSGCSKKEKKSSSNTIRKMKLFVDKHFTEIVCSSNYSMYYKLTAICTKAINPVLLWILNKTVNIHLLISKGKRYL